LLVAIFLIYSLRNSLIYTVIGHVQLQECDKQDVLFIYELPIDTAGGKQVEFVHDVFNSLRKNVSSIKSKDKCHENTFSLLVQSERPENVQPFDCDELCVETSRVTLQNMADTYRPRKK